MKSRNIITLLVITNIIFITMIWSLICKNVGFIKEKQIIKEMTQSENETNLQTQIDQLNLAHEEYATNVQNYKKQIADAITNKGVTTLETDTATVMAENIEKIATERAYTKISTSLTNTQVYVTETFYLLDTSITQVKYESASTGDNGIYIGSDQGVIKNWLENLKIF